EETLRKKLAGILEIYEKFVEEDPYTNPMRVFPAVHYSMGGLWVDFERSHDGSLVIGSPRNQATNIEGLYAAGECEYQYHGANRLGANSLLSCIWGGMVAGPAIATYVKNLAKGNSSDTSKSVFEGARKAQETKYQAILEMDGDENPYVLHEELASTMLMSCTIERHNPTLDKVLDQVNDIELRARKCGVTDSGTHANQGAPFIRHLFNMIVIARVIAQGARNRDESRGAQFKPEFPNRDDEKFLRTTMAMHKSGEGETNHEIDYVRELDYSVVGTAVHVTDEVDISLLKPRPRKYETAGAANATAAQSGKDKADDKSAAKPAGAPTGA
ncbi:MAG: FAD-binding protein, partial [Polyangiaceae bacterium]